MKQSIKVEPSIDTINKYLPWIAALSIFMQSLDGTILNTALPSIASDFGKDATTMQSVIVSYTLTLALLIPLSGWLSDRFGSRRIFNWAVAIFTIGSLLCAISQTLPQLILSRIFQAIGGSMMVPVARLAILYTYSKDKLLGVINFMTILGLVGPIIGPTLGGWLVDVASWHWVFLINLPIGILGIYFAYKIMPNYLHKVGKFDFVGMVYFSGGLIAITMAIEMGSANLISGYWIIGILLFTIIMMQMYYRHYKRTVNPLIDLRLIKIKTLRIGILGNLLTRIGIGGMPLLLPLLFQIGFGNTALVSGLMMIPVALTSVLVKPWVVPIVKKLGYKRTLLINTFVIACIIMLFAIPTQHTPLPHLIPILVIFGAANSIQLASMNTLSLSDLDHDTASGGNSLVTVMQQLSISLGISVGAFLLQFFSGLDFNTGSVILAFKMTFVAMGVLTAISALLFLRLDKEDGSKMSGHSTKA
jgi:EmrB/QacA subfamily drug resistance transporter